MCPKLFMWIFPVLFPAVVFAQEIELTGQKTYGGTDDDRLTGVVVTDNGNYVGVGSSRSESASGDKTEPLWGNRDGWVVCFTLDFEEKWQKSLGGNLSDGMWGVIQTKDGHLLCAGNSESPISGNKTAPNKGGMDYWAVKLDTTDGSILWQATYGGDEDDFLWDIAELGDGSLLFAGSSSSGISGDKTDTSRGSNDYWLVKTDATGSILWDKTMGGTSADDLFGITVNESQHILLVGTSSSDSFGEKTEDNYGPRDIWVVKLDSSGAILWDRTIGSEGFDFIVGSAEVLNHAIYIPAFTSANSSGTKSEDSKGGDDFWITKLDKNGNILWDKTIGGDEDDAARAIIKNMDTNTLVIGGRSGSGISGDKTEANKGIHDYWTVAIDTTGNIMWQKTIGGSEIDIMTSLAEISPDKYLYAGFSNSGISGDKTAENRGEDDYWLVQLSKTVNVAERSAAVPRFTAYPNPASDQLFIETSADHISTIEVLDLTGQMVSSVTAAAQKEVIDISGLSPGLYLVKVYMDDHVETKKVVVGSR